MGGAPARHAEIALVAGWHSPQPGLLHRWAILALLARAFLSVMAVARPFDGHPYDGQLILLTRHEIRGPFTGQCQQSPAPRIQVHWSRLRRRHQAPLAPATTGDEPLPTHDHEVSLKYQAVQPSKCCS